MALSHHLASRRTFISSATALAAIGIPMMSRDSRLQSSPVRVGSKDFPEQFILAQLFGQALSNSGIPTNLDAVNLGGTGIAHTALINGEIDLYPEYTGTSYTYEGIFGLNYLEVSQIVAATPTYSTPETSVEHSFSAADRYVHDAIVLGYSELGLTALDQTPFNNNQNLAVTRQFSTDYGVVTISDLAEWGTKMEIAISAPVDFEAPDRGDGFIALQQTYKKGFEAAIVTGVDPSLKYEAFFEGEANVVLAFGTDAEIPSNDLVLLVDDMLVFPPGHATPVVRNETIEQYPQIPSLINPLVNFLSTDAMVSMNVEVVVNGKDPSEVAQQFLFDIGIRPG